MKKYHKKPPIPICRICGSQFNLMHMLQGGQELLEKIWLCANIKVDFEGDLPQHLCLKCEQSLNFSYRLRKQGEAMEIRLRQQLHDESSKEENPVAAVADVEDALQEFRVANINQPKNGADDDDVQIISVTQNAAINSAELSCGKSSTINMKDGNNEDSKVIASRLQNFNKTIANVEPIPGTTKTIDNISLDDIDAYEEFITLENDDYQNVESNLEIIKQQSFNDGQDTDLEIIENGTTLNESQSTPMPQFKEQEISNDQQQIREDDDVQVVAEYSASTFEIPAKSSKINYQKDIVEYLERNRPVKVKVVNHDKMTSKVVEYSEKNLPVTFKVVNPNEVPPTVQIQQNDNLFMQQEPAGTKKQNVGQYLEDNSPAKVQIVYHNEVPPLMQSQQKDTLCLQQEYVCVNNDISSQNLETINPITIKIINHNEVLPKVQTQQIEKAFLQPDSFCANNQTNMQYFESSSPVQVNIFNHNEKFSQNSKLRMLLDPNYASNEDAIQYTERNNAIQVNLQDQIQQNDNSCMQLDSFRANKEIVANQCFDRNNFIKINKVYSQGVIQQNNKHYLPEDTARINNEITTKFLERNKSVTVKIINRKTASPQSNKSCFLEKQIASQFSQGSNPEYAKVTSHSNASYQESDISIMQQDPVCINEQITTVDNDIIEIEDDDIIEECEDNEPFVEYENNDFYKQNIEFESFEKKSIELIDVSYAEKDNIQNDTFLNPIIENNPIPNSGVITTDMRSNFKCDTCAEEFHNQSEYRVHIKQHGKERYICLHCNKWFPARSRLKEHERTHIINIEVYKCHLCGNSYRHRQNLRRHIGTAHGDNKTKTYNCNQCTEVFARADILKNHMIKHIVERNFVCDICSKSFKSHFYLMSHKRLHQSKATTSSTATNTGTCTSTSDDSSNPSQTESNKRTYYCAYCGKISKHNFAHKNHLRTHTLEMPYECEFCKKKFRTIAARSIHERTHTDDRPFQCELCSVSFRQSSHLNDHMLIHKGIMSHVCNICNMAFTKKSNMKVHMRIHTGERPYKCAETDCGQQFAKLAQLKRHAVQKHARNVDVLANDDDDELSSGNNTEEEGEVSDLLENDELDVGIGAEETAIELNNETYYNSLYVFE